MYAHYGVKSAWLVDPKTHTLEVYALADGKWQILGVFRDDDSVSVAPFDAITIHLSDLWTSG
jgi:Uma2 family endonuclease